jgi:hypothetical protein
MQQKSFAVTEMFAEGIEETVEESMCPICIGEMHAMRFTEQCVSTRNDPAAFITGFPLG